VNASVASENFRWTFGKPCFENYVLMFYSRSKYKMFYICEVSECLDILYFETEAVVLWNFSFEPVMLGKFLVRLDSE